MKKDIEHQIKDRRDDFDLEEPPKEIWNNIRSEWQQSPSDESYTKWWRVAAVILLVMCLGLLTHNYLLRKEVVELASLGDISPEYKALETQYQAEINQLTSQLPDNSAVNKTDYEWMFEELEALESINEQYRKDIGKVVDQERLVQALVDYYEKKIRLLKKLELEIKRQQNETDNTTSFSTI